MSLTTTDLAALIDWYESRRSSLLTHDDLTKLTRAALHELRQRRKADHEHASHWQACEACSKLRTDFIAWLRDLVAADPFANVEEFKRSVLDYVQRARELERVGGSVEPSPFPEPLGRCQHSENGKQCRLWNDHAQEMHDYDPRLLDIGIGLAVGAERRQARRVEVVVTADDYARLRVNGYDVALWPLDVEVLTTGTEGRGYAMRAARVLRKALGIVEDDEAT